MGKKDKKVDAYIAKSQDFAKPILSFIRETVHKGCPGVEEKIKWSFPNFLYKGGILCNMGAFKEHCTFGFWRAAILQEKGLLNPSDQQAMGQFGRITKISDLPSQTKLVKIVKEAARLNEPGIKSPIKKKVTVRKQLEIPGYFRIKLNKNKKAKITFDKFSQSHKNEYIEWITEAKTETTRDKRITTSIDYLSNGKPLNWKYMKK
ncbi:MAG TPA: YdeI/OmpD-associated family protein [Ignavibacteriaceae bacterium]|nr:YdeI/OmpD-associated family protein [Ignavibacteriaceae bacterium]